MRCFPFVRTTIISFLIVFLFTGCVYVFHKVKISTEVTEEQTISTPLKAHLHDGKTVLFHQGAVYSKDKFIGHGIVYSIGLQPAGVVTELDIGDIAAYEIFTKEVDPFSTFFISAGASIGAFFLTGLLLVAIFGSCPTVYSMTPDSVILEAELFSNSISPMLESRDIARLNVLPDENGTIQLEIRNEALETHYINHIELISIEQKLGSFAVPDNFGSPLSLNGFLSPVTAKNDSDLDISHFIVESDELFYSTATSFEPDKLSWDSIELVFPPQQSNEVALHVLGRNSLFSTVYLYDFLLGGRGIKALDWLGTDLATVSEAVALGEFYQKYMGIRVDIMNDGEYNEIASISNVGPIAWKDLAVAVSDVNPTDSLRIRLRYLSDSWQFDLIRLASEVKRPIARHTPVSRLLNSTGVPENAHIGLINSSDQEYLVTQPGDRFFIEFDTDKNPEGHETGYFLAAQGYYLEWIRQDWIKDPDPFFTPDYTEEMMIRVQQHWAQVKNDFEKQFFELKIPVR